MGVHICNLKTKRITSVRAVIQKIQKVIAVGKAVIAFPTAVKPRKCAPVRDAGTAIPLSTAVTSSHRTPIYPGFVPKTAPKTPKRKKSLRTAANAGQIIFISGKMIVIPGRVIYIPGTVIHIAEVAAAAAAVAADTATKMPKRRRNQKSRHGWAAQL